MINETQAKRYCSEDISNIENYEQAINDKTQTWDIHHRLEIQGQFYNSASLLKRCGLYCNIPASQLIFLTHFDHMRIHKIGSNFGRKGKPSNRKGVHLIESTKTKMSEAKRGRHWYNDGEKSVCVRECPVGFKKGRL